MSLPAGLDVAAVQRLLSTRWVGCPLLWFPGLDSTQEEARRRARQGAGPGLVVGAESQTAGRGRRGRVWRDRPGASLLFSVLLPPPTEHPGLLTVGVAAYLAAALETVSGAAVGVQWPNDLVLGRAKLGGLLAEVGEGVCVLGVGVNVVGPAPELADGDRRTAAALYPAGEQPGRREAVLVACLGAIEAAAEDLHPAGGNSLLARITERDALRGREVRVSSPQGQWRGRAAGVSPEGALLLETPTGTREVWAADALHVEA